MVGMGGSSDEVAKDKREALQNKDGAACIQLCIVSSQVAWYSQHTPWRVQKGWLM